MFLCLLGFSVVIFSLSTALQGAPALVGHTSLAGQALDADGAKAVLLGKKITLDGTRVVIVVAKAGDAQNTFLQTYTGMTTSQFLNHWRRLFMTGGGTAPRVVETEAEARKLVSETPGAITITDVTGAAGLAVLTPSQSRP